MKKTEKKTRKKTAKPQEGGAEIIEVTPLADIVPENGGCLAKENEISPEENAGLSDRSDRSDQSDQSDESDRSDLSDLSDAPTQEPAPPSTPTPVPPSAGDATPTALPSATPATPPSAAPTAPPSATPATPPSAAPTAPPSAGDAAPAAPAAEIHDLDFTSTERDGAEEELEALESEIEDETALVEEAPGAQAYRTPAALKAAIECLLFTTPYPLSLAKLRVLLGKADLKTLRGAVSQLQMEYDARGGGLQVLESAEGYQMCTRPEYAEVILNLHQHRKRNPLSLSALETLAIIAYKQPVTRAEIEMIRGVESSGVVRNLCDMGLVKVVGRKEVIGRPQLYGTTNIFLNTFGLKNTSDLPSIQSLRRQYSSKQAAPPAPEAVPPEEGASETAESAAPDTATLGEFAAGLESAAERAESNSAFSAGIETDNEDDFDDEEEDSEDEEERPFSLNFDNGKDLDEEDLDDDLDDEEEDSEGEEERPFVLNFENGKDLDEEDLDEDDFDDEDEDRDEEDKKDGDKEDPDREPEA